MQVVSRQCQNEALRKKDDQVTLTLSDSTDPSGSKRTPLSALSPRSFRDHGAESPEIASRDDRIPKDAIMCHVRLRHQKTIIPNRGSLTRIH